MFKIIFSLLLSVVLVQAQEYPSKNITLIVPFAAGGASDVVGRIIAEEMSLQLKTTIVIENVPGAGGSTALTRLTKSDADGYTIAIGNSGTNAAAFTIYPEIKYKPDEFSSIGLVARTAPIIALKNDFPANSVKEFIEHSKKNPGLVTLGHAGVGSNNYLVCLNFIKAAQIDVRLVGYRGAAPALNDAMGGHVDGVCDNAVSLKSAILGDKVKGLVVANDKRLVSIAKVPSSVEAGIPEFNMQGWNALFAPLGTPKLVIEKLNAALLKASSSEKLIARFNELESIIPPSNQMTPAYLDMLVKADVEKYRLLLAK